MAVRWNGPLSTSGAFFVVFAFGVNADARAQVPSKWIFTTIGHFSNYVVFCSQL